MRKTSAGLLALALASSAIAVSWTRVTATAAWEPRQGHACVVFNNKIWVLGGFGGGGEMLNDVWYSTDGALWTQATASAPWSPRWLFPAVAFGGRLWVLGGSYENDVWYSTDGANWTQATPHAGWTGRLGHTSLVYERWDDTISAIWVLGGDDGAELHDVWRSSDGANWEQVTPAAAWAERSQHSSCVFRLGADSFMTVVGSGSNYGYSNECWYLPLRSSEWGQMQPGSWSERRRHSSVSFQDRLWVLGGEDVSGMRSDVWCYDGSDWTCTNASAGWSARDNQASIVFNNKIWVLGGYDGNDQVNDVWCSTGLSAVEDSRQASPIPSVLISVCPNPTRAGASIQYTLARTTKASLSVYSCSGVEVRSLSASLEEAGSHSVRWSGVDNSGRDVAPGIYFVRLEVNGLVEEKKIVRFR